MGDDDQRQSEACQVKIEALVLLEDNLP
ncbi:hypothetical protein LCGC14_2771400, partial [marine sediment metagenome]